MSVKYSFDRLLSAGISFEDACQLRRIAMTLQRWFEMECGDSNNYYSWCIARGRKNGAEFEYDDDGKPYREEHWYNTNKVRYFSMADRERGALRRLAAIMAKYEGLTYYVQGDPRGASLYVGNGLTDSNYSNGIAVYK